jgi:hypothetical protein
LFCPVRILIFNFQSPALGVFANHTHLIADRKLPVFRGLPDVNGGALGWQFCVSCIHTNKLVAADDEIKIAACLFPDFESNSPGTLRSALKNNSMALFIGAERFPRIAFQENSQVVWSGFTAAHSSAQGEWQR